MHSLTAAPGISDCPEENEERQRIALGAAVAHLALYFLRHISTYCESACQRPFDWKMSERRRRRDANALRLTSERQQVVGKNHSLGREAANLVSTVSLSRARARSPRFCFRLHLFNHNCRHIPSQNAWKRLHRKQVGLMLYCPMAHLSSETMASLLLRRTSPTLSKQAYQSTTIRRASTLPTTIKPSQDEIVSGRLGPRNLEAAVRSIHLDGLAVVENVIPHKELDHLNTKMTADARILQARGKNSPFNYHVGNLVRLAQVATNLY